MIRPNSVIPKGVAFVPISVPVTTQEFIFCVVPDFTLLAFSSAIEPLRIANQLAQKPLFRWEVRSLTGDPVISSSGVPVGVTGDLTEIPPEAVLLLCAGNGALRSVTAPYVNALNRHYRHGGQVGGICTGAVGLAKAGLLAKRKFTLHWENQLELQEAFPDLHPTSRKFEIDRNVLTCGGGSASIDLMLDIIASSYGADFASIVSEMCIRRTHLGVEEDQRSSLAMLLQTRNPILLAIVGHMQKNLEEPLSLEELTDKTGYSRRHIERVFKTNLGQSPGTYYRNLRLDHARTLLSTTNKRLIDIAAASGFVSVSHFSRLFKARYGISPTGFLSER